MGAAVFGGRGGEPLGEAAFARAARSRGFWRGELTGLAAFDLVDGAEAYFTNMRFSSVSGSVDYQRRFSISWSHIVKCTKETLTL